MDFRSEAAVAGDATRAFAVVRDLGSYPSWFSIVDRADPIDAGAWAVDLAARLGPIKRTKRVRMRRTVDDQATGHARFERDEADGRDHSPWVLDAQVDDAGPGRVRVRMGLHYGGVVWLPGVDLLLREEARRAAARLERLLRE